MQLCGLWKDAVTHDVVQKMMFLDMCFNEVLRINPPAGRFVFVTVYVVHTQPFNSPFSGTIRVSQYQKKHLPTHTYEEEEGFAQTTRSALSQWRLLGQHTTKVGRMADSN